MNRHCLDARVWGPLVLASALLLLRGTGPAAPPPRDTAHAVELPQLRGAPLPSTDSDYELDVDRSTVRFLVEANDGAMLTACRRIGGHLHLAGDGGRCTLELDLDLGSLEAVGGGEGELDLWRHLGVHRGSELFYRATLIRTATNNLPGVTQRVWLGTLRLDDRAVQQPMLLWQVSLPGQPLRLQGHGSVAGDTYGLPSHGWFGFAPHAHVVNLGLDLVWRRHRGR